MNEIQIINNRIAEMEKRQATISTPQGMASVEKEIITIFGVLVAYGYKMPDADEMLMAKVWGASLKEYFILYGSGTVKRAVMNFAENDTRDYKAFPTVAEIIAEAKKIGVNPKAELAKLKAKQEEEAIEMEHKKEYEKLWEELPEEKKALFSNENCGNKKLLTSIYESAIIGEEDEERQ